LLTLPGLTATTEETKVNGKKYGPEYFYAIEGEVYGQAAPGIEAVLVNGKEIPFDKNLIFRSKVSLGEGQKYLTVETRYKGLRFIKKYLVIRHPKAQKTFKVHLPQKEFTKIIERREAVAAKQKTTTTRRRRVAKRPPPRPEKPKPAPTLKEILEKVTTPEIVKVETPETPAVKEVRKPLRQRIADWFASRFGRRRVSTGEAIGIMESEAREIIEKEAVIIVKRDAPEIIRTESRKFIEKEAPKIVRKEARDLLKEKYPDEEILALLKEEAPKILEKEIEKVIERDLPAGQGLSIIKKEIQKIVNKEAPKVIEQEARRIISSRMPTAEVIAIVEKRSAAIIEAQVRAIIDKDALWKIAKDAVINEALKAVNKDELRKVAKDTVIKKALNSVDEAALQKEATRILEKEAKKHIETYASKIINDSARKLIEEKVKAMRRPLKAKGPKFLTPSGEWAEYDLVIELEPNRLLLIKRVNGRYVGNLFTVDTRIWMPLKEISYQEFKDLLEKGKIPKVYKPLKSS
jgi:hypothetical protein